MGRFSTAHRTRGRGLNHGPWRGRRRRVGQIPRPPTFSSHVRQRSASWPPAFSFSWPPTADTITSWLRSSWAT